jgi:hypothetical protein
LSIALVSRVSEISAFVRNWPSTSIRCAAAIFPESKDNRAWRGRDESDAIDPKRTYSISVTKAQRRCSLFRTSVGAKVSAEVSYAISER